MGRFINRLRDRARLSAKVSEVIRQELKHHDGDDLSGLEQRVRDRLEREYGDTPLWQLILELLIKLLPLLLDDAKTSPLDAVAAPPAPETVEEPKEPQEVFEAAAVPSLRRKKKD